MGILFKMRATLVAKGQHFGNLLSGCAAKKSRGIITFHTSPMEMKTFETTVFKFAGVKNVVFNLWNIGPGIGIAAACIHFGAEAYGQSMRKQPGAFDHEQ